VSGAKIDFFDQRDTTGEKTDDLEDTQQRLQVRDFLGETRRQAPPGGRVPRLRSAFGRAPPLAPPDERRGRLRARAQDQNLQHDLTIPYVRNIMGPTSYTPLHLSRSAGSHAYQLGQTVLYEAGIQIFSERHDHIREFAGKDFPAGLPSTWTTSSTSTAIPRATPSSPGARAQTGSSAASTAEPRSARIPLAFLDRGVSYQADLYRDGDSKTSWSRKPGPSPARTSSPSPCSARAASPST